MASSLRRNVASLGVAIAVAVAVAFPLQPDPPRSQAAGPQLAWFAEPCPATDALTRRSQLQAAIWLTFASLTAERQAALLDLGEALLDAAEARRHPLIMQLADDPTALFAEHAPWLLPVWASADGVTRSCFATGDGALSVRVKTAGEAFPDGASRFHAWAAAAVPSKPERMARFVAWPVCAAAPVRPRSERPSDPWLGLRRVAGRAGSAVALVVDAPAQAVHIDARIAPAARVRLDALRSRLLRLDLQRCHACAPFADLIDALRSGFPTAPVLPWLRLIPGQALVVPRLSEVGRPAALRHELATFGLTAN